MPINTLDDDRYLSYACTQYGLPTPTTVTAATAAREATTATLETALAAITAEQPAPTGDLYDPKDLPARLEALTAWQTHDVRKQYVVRLLNAAKTRRDWGAGALTEVWAPFEAAFTKAADVFTTALGADTTPVEDLDRPATIIRERLAGPVGTLTGLSRVRDFLARPDDFDIRHVMQVTRVCRPTSKRSLSAALSVARNHQPTSIGYWASLARIDGCELRWNTNAEQEAIYDACLRKHPTSRAVA